MVNRDKFKINNDKVRARCLYVRTQIMQKSQEVAALEMGYKNTTTISKMEKSTSKTGINLEYVRRLAIWAVVNIDFILGRTDMPDFDPQSMQNVLFYHQVKGMLEEQVDRFSKSVTAMVRDESLEWHVKLISEQIGMLKNSLNRFRELNPVFEVEMRGGGNLVKAIDKVDKTTRLAVSHIDEKSGAYARNIKRLESALADEQHSRQIDYIGRA